MNSSNQDAVLKRSELLLSTEYAEPEDLIGKALADIWQQVLNIDSIGVNDDFFEIGGDSLGASVIAGEIELRYGCKFSPSHIIDFSTISRQSAYIQKENLSADSIPSNLIVFNSDGKKTPLFFIHGAVGFSLYGKQFLDGFDKDRPLIFIEAVGLDGKAQALESVEEIAANYISSMRLMAPGGHWLLAANCAGGLIAMEICKQAELTGDRVDRLLLVDPLPRLFRKTYHVRLRRLRKKITHKLLPKQIRSRLKLLMSSEHDDETIAYEKSIHDRNRRRALLEARIENSQSSLVPSQIPYNTQAMLKVLDFLSNAFEKYASSKWRGPTSVIVTSERKGRLKTLKYFFPNANFRVAAYDHQSLFDDGLSEILDFLEHSLSSDRNSQC